MYSKKVYCEAKNNLDRKRVLFQMRRQGLVDSVKIKKYTKERFIYIRNTSKHNY